MTNSNIKCPACGSDHLERKPETRAVQLTLGDEFSFEEENYKCLTCGEEGDFAMKNDERFEVAEKAAEKGLVIKLIDRLSTQSISMARFGRAFELPQRTLNRWKTGDCSATSLALLRTITTCPWLVDVAEHRFEPSFVNITVCNHSMHILESELKRHSSSPIAPSMGVYVWNSSNSVGAMAVATKPDFENVIAPGTQQIAVGG